jgi:hypothetical protein
MSCDLPQVDSQRRWRAKRGNIIPPAVAAGARWRVPIGSAIRTDSARHRNGFLEEACPLFLLLFAANYQQSAEGFEKTPGLFRGRLGERPGE